MLDDLFYMANIITLSNLLCGIYEIANVIVILGLIVCSNF